MVILGCDSKPEPPSLMRMVLRTPSGLTLAMAVAGVADFPSMVTVGGFFAS